MKHVASTEGFDCPDFHLSETLTTKLGFTTKRLLSDERVRSDRTCVHLIFYHVTELKHVGHTYCCLLVEFFTGGTIIKLSCAVAGKTSLVGPFAEVFEVCTVEDGGSKLETELLTSVTKYGFKHLSDVHTRRHTEGVKYDVDGSTISEEWHIFLTHDLRDNTLVTVATCHLITDTNLTLLSDVDLSHLDDATGEFIADGDGILFAHTLGIHLVELAEIVDDKCTNHAVDASITSPVFQLKRSEVESCKEALRELSTLGYNFCTDVVLHTERGEVLGERNELIEHDTLEFVGFAVELIVDFLKTFFVFELFCTREFVNATEEALVDYNT